MNYFDRVQRAIDYIEVHIIEELSLEDIAKQAYASLFHFHRIFQAVTGDSMKEYIRKRRLSLAGRELAETDARIIDVALKYGYETPEAFAKAFKKLHGITPSECRRKKGCFYYKDKAYVHIYKSKLEGGKDSMEYKIIEKDSFKIVGRELRVRNDNGDNFRLIPKFWDDCMKDGIFDQFEAMPNMINKQSKPSMGMCMDFDGINTFSYLICVEVSNFDCIPEGMTSKTIPASKYAVFTAKAESKEKTSDAIQETWKDIYAKWFPVSGYERTDGPDFELYDERCGWEKPEVDIYIPIK
jgi:AraC family transcriptional regulator